MLEAVKRLNSNSGIVVKKASQIYETVPVGGSGQQHYFNAAVEIETTLDELELLRVCLSIEKSMGRIRYERWGQRNIDIDILFYNHLIMEKAELTIPHPLAHERGFVLQPLSDIAPDMIHPVLGLTVSELKSKVKLEGVVKVEDLNLDM